jgi:hypothetical protein
VLNSISEKNSESYSKEAQARELLNAAYQQGSITLDELVKKQEELRIVSQNQQKESDKAKAAALGYNSMQEAAAADSGVIYVDDDGTVIFADRDAIISDDRSINVQSTYDTTDAAGKKFVDTSIVYDDSLIYNIVKIDRKVTTAAGGETLTGTTVIVSNAESISLYGARTLAIEVPIVSTVGSDTSYGQNEASDLALFLASQYANPELRPEEIRFAPQGNPSTLYPDLLSRKIRDRVTVKFAVPGGGSAVERDCFVESVGHTITPGNWNTTFGLTSATFYTCFFILDNTGFGVLDTNKLSF